MLERITLRCPKCGKLVGLVTEQFAGTIFIKCSRCKIEIAFYNEHGHVLRQIR